MYSWLVSCMHYTKYLLSMASMNKGQIILYQTQRGESKIEVRLANESVWLTADQMAELFQRNKSISSICFDSTRIFINFVTAVTVTAVTGFDNGILQ